MTLKSGHCSECGIPVWRTVTAQREKDGSRAGEEILLWPMPTSCYVVARVSPDNIVPGLAYCQECAPRFGTIVAISPTMIGVVEKVEPALERYKAWYEPERELFYRAWLNDHIGCTEPEINAHIDQWHHDQRFPEFNI